MDRARQILGVDSDADEVAIRRAFKRLALDLHPDRGGDEERFKEAQLACDVLLGRARAPSEWRTPAGDGATAPSRKGRTESKPTDIEAKRSRTSSWVDPRWEEEAQQAYEDWLRGRSRPRHDPVNSGYRAALDCTEMYVDPVDGRDVRRGWSEDAGDPDADPD